MPGDRTPLWARPTTSQDATPVEESARADDAALEFRRADDPTPALAASSRKAGTGADDRFVGASLRDTLIGRAGEDTLKGRGGDDVIRGGAAGDRLIGGGGSDRVIGGGGGDLVKGGGGDDILKGGGGNDRLVGGAGSDTLIGGKGDDTLIGGGKDDVFVFADAHLRDGVKTILGFRSGVDRIDISGVSGVGRFEDIPATRAGGATELAIGGGTIRITGDAPEAADFIVRDALEFARSGGSSPALAAPVRKVGTREDENLVGTSDRDVLIGRGGDDTLKGRGGDDVIRGGGGDDRLIGGGGSDRVIGGGGNDLVKGGGGDDLLKGGGGNDRLVGGPGSDRLIGGKGDDTMIGGGKDDVFVFTDGHLRDGVKTILRFKSGMDTIDLSKVSGVERFEDLSMTRSGNVTELAISGAVIRIAGNAPDAFDFVFRGGTASPVAPDPFTGGPGPDALTSGPGNDLIQGLGGNDTLGAGAGVDTLVGGEGSDIFVVRLVNGQLDGTVDVVRDFTYAAGDKVSLVEALSGVSFDRLDEVANARIVGADTIISVKRGAAFQDVMRLEGVNFTTEQLISYGFKAPAGNGAFVDNPYGFANNSFATADPAATRDGTFVAWVDKQNLDNDPLDRSANGNTNENSLTRDVFIVNTETGALQRVSTRDSFFHEASSPALSADGRFVAYLQEPTGNSGNNGDVFVRDMAFPDTAPIRVSVDDNGNSSGPGTPFSTGNRGGLAGSTSNESVSLLDISGDGRKVVFVTRTDLSGAGESDSNGAFDVYLRDLDAGETTLISANAGVAGGVVSPYQSGSAGRETGDIVKISEDGRYVGFISSASFVSGDTDGVSDLYLFDTVTQQFLLVSTAAPGGVFSFDMSADGSRIAFSTLEAIEAGDANGNVDVYVADINLSNFSVSARNRVSEAEGGFEVRDNDSFAPIISHDGRTVGFLSTARDLTNYDPNIDFEQSGGFGGNSLERLYVVDLATGALSVPDVRLAVADRDSLIAHAALTADGIVVRQSITDTAPNSGRQGIGDSIATAGLIPVPDVADVPSNPNSGSGVRLEKFTSVRSVIDSPSDKDVFVFRTGSSDSRDFSITIEGADSNAGTLADPDLVVRRGSITGTIVGDDDNSGFGRNAFAAIDASASNTYFIEVSSADGGLGSYRLTINEDQSPTDGLF